MPESSPGEKRGGGALIFASVLLLAFSLALLVTNFLPTRHRLEQLENESRDLRRQIEHLRRETNRLDAEADAARDDAYYQERLYRRTYRYREDGEKVIYFEDDRSSDRE